MIRHNSAIDRHKNATRISGYILDIQQTTLINLLCPAAVLERVVSKDEISLVPMEDHAVCGDGLLLGLSGRSSHAGLNRLWKSAFRQAIREALYLHRANWGTPPMAVIRLIYEPFDILHCCRMSSKLRPSLKIMIMRTGRRRTPQKTFSISYGPIVRFRLLKSRQKTCLERLKIKE